MCIEPMWAPRDAYEQVQTLESTLRNTHQSGIVRTTNRQDSGVSR